MVLYGAFHTGQGIDWVILSGYVGVGGSHGHKATSNE